MSALEADLRAYAEALVLDRGDLAYIRRTLPEGRLLSDDEMTRLLDTADALYAEIERLRADAWQPIETAPQDGYMLVHEDGAIRALLRINGAWHRVGYPSIISHPWGDVIVGDDAKRILPAGYRLELRDGCCEAPTHWRPLPDLPADTARAGEGEAS